MEEIIEDEAEGSGQEAVEESNEPMLEDIPLELPNLEPEAPTETPIENLDVPNLDSPQEVPVEQPEKPPQGE
jgi:hypothetical protein